MLKFQIWWQTDGQYGLYNDLNMLTFGPAAGSTGNSAIFDKLEDLRKNHCHHRLQGVKLAHGPDFHQF